MHDVTSRQSLRSMLPLGRLGLALSVVLYVLLQSVSVAHATQWGDAEHTHHGEACLLSKFSTRDDDGVLPPVGIIPPVPAAGHHVLEQPAVLAPRGRHSHRACARAPPHSS